MCWHVKLPCFDPVPPQKELLQNELISITKECWTVIFFLHRKKVELVQHWSTSFWYNHVVMDGTRERQNGAVAPSRIGLTLPLAPINTFCVYAIMYTVDCKHPYTTTKLPQWKMLGAATAGSEDGKDSKWRPTCESGCQEAVLVRKNIYPKA